MRGDNNLAEINLAAGARILIPFINASFLSSRAGGDGHVLTKSFIHTDKLSIVEYLDQLSDL